MASATSMKKHDLADGEEKPNTKQIKTSSYKNVKEYLEGNALDPLNFNPDASNVIYKVPVVPLKVSGDQNESGDQNCYFMTATPNVKFRHQGVDESCPPEFY